MNATSVGLDPGRRSEALAALGLDGLEPPRRVVDLVYGDDGDARRARGRARAGARVVDGLEVLVRQGARSFELWTGRSAPLDVMRPRREHRRSPKRRPTRA